MLIPPLTARAEDAGPHFAALRALRSARRHAARPNVDLRELSMGMSGDLEVAVAEGATLVRVGTAIFGRARDGGEVSDVRHAPCVSPITSCELPDACAEALTPAFSTDRAKCAASLQRVRRINSLTHGTQFADHEPHAQTSDPGW